MIVTTGGRSTRSSGASSNSSRISSSSAACRIVISRSISAAISSTSSSESDCVTVFGVPIFIRILMISGTFWPSACERFWTVIPDSTVTGPVCGTISRGCFGWRGVSSRRWRESWRGRPAPVSITTRRLRPACGLP